VTTLTPFFSINIIYCTAFSENVLLLVIVEYYVTVDLRLSSRYIGSCKWMSQTAAGPAIGGGGQTWQFDTIRYEMLF